MKKYFLNFFFLLPVFVFGQQNIELTKADQLIDSLVSNDLTHGQVLIMQGDSIVYQRSFGKSAIYSDTDKPNTNQTYFRIGSVTKSFIATMIFQLIEEDRLSLDTYLSKFFPRIPNSKKIQIVDMLSHQSGLKNYTQIKNFSNWAKENRSRRKLMKRLYDMKTGFEPKSRVAYSNTNYFLLGLIVEKLDRRSLQKSLEKRIFEPLALNHIFLGEDFEYITSSAHPYMYTDCWEDALPVDLDLIGGAGAIVSQPSDLATFIHALFSSDQLLNDKSRAEMMTFKNVLGRGCMTVPFYEYSAVGHNGDINGFLTNAYYFSDQDMTIVCCLNASRYPINNLIVGVLSDYYKKEFTIPNFRGVQLNDSDLQKCIGNYFSNKTFLELKVYHKNNELYGQIIGQSPFYLKAKNKLNFTNEGFGIKVEFITTKSGKITGLLLKQRGQELLFDRKKEEK
ncbi:MAG: serine hydrolase domain-containing protein [Bacteroidales bacterium]